MLSIDAGRPAPMTYNFQQQQPQQQPNLHHHHHHQQQQQTQLSRGMIGNGFSSRGKAESIRKISIPSLPTISTSSYDDESHAVSSPFPQQRNSGRSQLLAGLRTAPKTPTMMDTPEIGFNNSAIDYQTNSNWGRPTGANPYPFKSQRALGYNYSTHGSQNAGMPTNPPRSIQTEAPQESLNRFSIGKYASLPTPPASSSSSSSSYIGQNEVDYEAQVYADLLARNISLAQQQQILQQQMRIVQQAQQLQQVHSQIQQLQIQSPVAQTVGTPPISPAVYSPATSGLQPNFQFYGGINTSNSQPAYQAPYSGNHTSLPVAISPEHSSPPGYVSRTNVSSSPPRSKPISQSPPTRPSPSPSKDLIRSEFSVPEKTPSPPAANSSNFRRGHKKCSSLSSCINANATANVADNGPKTSVPKFSNMPSTPINSTFGGRGDHPIRQPRGPPALEEILARPSAKFEGSKNFSSRQRRRALSKLVNAGIERRGTRPLSSTIGGMASVSENDIVLCFDDTDSASSSSPRADHDREFSRGTEEVKSSLKIFSNRSTLAIPHTDVATAEKRRSALF